MSKPNPGTPINWAHPLSKYLVASFPFNEGRGDFVKEYVNEGGEYSVGISSGFTTKPVWNTVGKVLCLDSDLAARASNGSGLDSGSAYFANTSTDQGYTNIPPIDWSHGFTVHLWAQLGPTASSSENLFSIGNATDTGSIFYISAETFFGNWRWDIGLQSRSPAAATSPVYTAANDSLPNEIIVSYERAGTNAWTMKAWDTWGTLIIDTGGTGDYTAGLLSSVGAYELLGIGGNSGFGQWGIYAANVWNRPLGEYAVKALLGNPLQMYQASNTGGIAGKPGPPPDLPTVTLTATPASISAGYPSTLSWTSGFADTLSIDNGIGSVIVPSGTFVVFPLVTTTYTITATNDFGFAQASATVTVSARGQGRPVGVSPGAILQRDLTRSSDAGLGPTDNGVAYPAFVVIGSVVLSHPSELAMVLFLTTEALATGSHPTVSVVLDEIEGTIAVPFTSLGAFVPDTPVLVASQTLFSDRFYISQTQLPAVCRHMQVKVTWPTEIAANELLTWSVIGANIEER